MAFEIAEDGRVVVVKVRGFFDEAAADDHVQRLRAVLVRFRRRSPDVAVLVDLREASVPAPDCGRIMAQRTGSLYRGGDRVALLVDSALLRLQIARVSTPGSRFAMFDDERSARAFLDA